jgi:hypothetical protein
VILEELRGLVGGRSFVGAQCVAAHCNSQVTSEGSTVLP